MPKYNGIRVKANNSTLTTAPNSARTVSYRDFEIEMNAKNKAYYFIISHGLLKQFAEFCKNYHSNDPHKDCLESLLSNVQSL